MRENRHKDDEIFLIQGKELNSCIWAVEQMMELFSNNDEMLQRMGRLRDQLAKKMCYLDILDNLGLTEEAPDTDTVSFTEFLAGLGLKPYNRKGGKNN